MPSSFKNYWIGHYCEDSINEDVKILRNIPRVKEYTLRPCAKNDHLEVSMCSSSLNKIVNSSEDSHAPIINSSSIDSIFPQIASHSYHVPPWPYQQLKHHLSMDMYLLIHHLLSVWT